MFPGSAGGALPWAVIGHRTFDAKVPPIEVGDDQEKRRGRIRGEVGLHAPSPTTSLEPDKGRYQAQYSDQPGMGLPREIPIDGYSDPIVLHRLGMTAQFRPVASSVTLVWPTLWDDAAKISRKMKSTERRVQDPATRAWNILNALFYKAGRAPWRLPRADDAYATSYLGIGFYRDLDGHRLWTSTAQMFDERGKGLILRGARARTDRPGKHPYLAREDAYDLVKKSLRHYQLHHRQLPARLVIMKTSRFEKGEAEGFAGAIEEAGVAMTDMLWVSEGGHVMLMREGDYPSLRGSFVQLGENGLLYTRGSVPYYGTYPGARVPRPLHLRPHNCETPLPALAAEVLALTKMNWNSTQFDQTLPIPIRAARQVGRVLKHVSYGEREQSDYPFYM